MCDPALPELSQSKYRPKIKELQLGPILTAREPPTDAVLMRLPTHPVMLDSTFGSKLFLGVDTANAAATFSVRLTTTLKVDKVTFAKGWSGSYHCLKQHTCIVYAARQNAAVGSGHVFETTLRTPVAPGKLKHFTVAGVMQEGYQFGGESLLISKKNVTFSDHIKDLNDGRGIVRFKSGIRDVTGIFIYLAQPTLINTAVLGAGKIQVPFLVYAVSGNGEVSKLSTVGLKCTSSNTKVS